MKFKPYVKISMNGTDIERFLNMCSHHNIILEEIYLNENTYYAILQPLDFFSLKSLAHKSNVKIKIIAKSGFVFWLNRRKNRKILYLFPFFCMFVIWISSHFLWNVTLLGNSSITTDIIKDYLLEKGVHFGMALKEIPIKDIKNGIMDTYPQINWVSVMVEGTTLNILINENNNFLNDRNSIAASSDIVAPVSGIIESVYLRNGTLMVEEGMEVTKGDVLISSRVPITVDHLGETKENTYVADGDIAIIADYPIEEIIDLKHISSNYTGRKAVKYQLQFNNRSIILPNSHLPFACYDSVSEDIEHPLLTIFSIPLQIKKLTFFEYYPIEEQYSKIDAENLLKERLQQIIISLEEKGVQIIEKNVKIETNSVYCKMSGSIRIRVVCDKHGILEDNP